MIYLSFLCGKFLYTILFLKIIYDMNHLCCLFATWQKIVKFDKNWTTKYLLYQNQQKQLYILFSDFAESTLERKIFEEDLEDTLLSYGDFDISGKIIPEKNYENFDDINWLEYQIFKQSIYIPKISDE